MFKAVTDLHEKPFDTAPNTLHQVQEPDEGTLSNYSILVDLLACVTILENKRYEYFKE